MRFVSIGINLQDVDLARMKSREKVWKKKLISVTQNGNYIAMISIKGKKKHIGCYTTPKEASEAYNQYINDNNLEHTRS